MLVLRRKMTHNGIRRNSSIDACGLCEPFLVGIILLQSGCSVVIAANVCREVLKQY